MNLIETARDLLAISQYMKQVLDVRDYEEGDLYDFDQTWGSTALGFGGMGGQMMTTARTYVFVPKFHNEAYVFFGSEFAYKIKNPNEKFREDIRNHRMASVMESGRYKS